MEIKNELLSIEKEELIGIWSIALAKLFIFDKALLESNVQERSLAFRLAVYLREQLCFLEKHQIFVDVEYNRDGEDKIKRPIPENSTVKYPIAKKDAYGCPVCKKTWIAPDIILHERGSRENGFRNDIFWCEIKKNSNSEDKATVERICNQMRDRKYLFGIDLYKLTYKETRLDLYTCYEDKKPEKYIYCKRDSYLIKK